MYFSGICDGAEGMCLRVATTESPAGPFDPEEEPLRCGDGFVNIDPMPFDDPKTGKCLLYWGSDSSPIMVQELAEDRVSFAPGSSPKELIYPRWVHKINGHMPVDILYQLVADEQSSVQSFCAPI